jgi:murein endopeptidase
MIDPALAFLYFGFPTVVGLIGLAAVKLHERSVPPLIVGDLSRDGV